MTAPKKAATKRPTKKVAVVEGEPTPDGWRTYYVDPGPDDAVTHSLIVGDDESED